MTKTRALLLTFMACFTLLTYGTEERSRNKRLMQPDDLFRLETLGSVVISPDGASVAYELQRPLATVSAFGRERMWGNDRSDVWVASVQGGSPHNITNGFSDASGFWGPMWSPDGQWLAMFSSRGGNVRIWVWQKSSGRLRLLSEDGVNPWSDTSTWISDHQLVYATLAPGEESPILAIDAMARERASEMWAEQRKGQRATASTLESGVPVSLDDRPRHELRVADVSTDETRVLSRALDFSTVRASPNGLSIAFLQQIGIWQPGSSRPVTELNTKIYRAQVVGAVVPSTPHSMLGAERVFAGSLLWSPNSRELALIGYKQVSSQSEQVLRCNASDGKCRAASKPAVRLDLLARNQVSTPPYLWCGGQNLLIRGSVHESEELGTDGKSLNWWTTDLAGHPREFFVELPEGTSKTPSDVVADSARNGVVAILEGKAWEVGPDGALIRNLTSGVEAKITSVVRSTFSGPSDDGKLLFIAANNNQSELLVLDRTSGETITLTKPLHDAELVAFDHRRRTFVFTANNATGTYVWIRQAGRQDADILTQTNLFLRGIDEGKLNRFVYRSLEGQALTAWIILPPGYRDDHRYPVIVWIYPGQVQGNDEPLLTRISDCHPLNLQLLAAHGYIVLMPSMPLPPYGEAGDPYMSLTNGVIPAVDKLIDLGIADPDQIGLIGHSNGGYGVFGLITQTARFKAAASLAGPSDLVSMYGTFDAARRYDSFVHENSFRMWDAETSGMGGPPWMDEQRYIRNSPITYAGRVTTPVLIIQGDLDFVPLQQGEEFFTALYRQNKRAEFVRYFGEDHILTSPGNVRDMWRRLYRWFDEFLEKTRSDGKPS